MEFSAPHFVTPSTSLDMAACLNNRGVELLGAGDFASARDHFRKALATLTTSARATLGNANMSDNATGFKADFSDHSASLFSETSPLHCDAGTESMSIYNQAIAVPIGGHWNSNGGESLDHSLSSACCIFNIALIYHIRGLQAGNSKREGGSQRQRLQKAQSLYDKCSRLVFSQGLGCYIGAHPVADLLSMAVLNNHAHVFYELSCYDSARECNDCLLYVASMVAPCVYKNQEVECAIHQAKQNFCLNTFILQPPTVAHAA